MNPTTLLRFVEREVHVPVPEFGPNWTKSMKGHVLQQWWQSGPHPLDGEWRDVPLEEEA